jgi:hypothetical protein
MLNVSQQIGGTLGLSILITVFATAARNFGRAQLAASPPTGSPTPQQLRALQNAALAHGWATAFEFAAIFAAIAFVVTLVGIHVAPSEAGTEQPLPAG